MSDNARKRVTQKDVAGTRWSLYLHCLVRHQQWAALCLRGDTRASTGAVQELGYRPNKHAQMLMRQKWDSEQSARQFGIVVGGGAATITRPFYGEIIAGIYEEAHRCQMRVRFLQFLDELSDPLLFNELIHPEEISGLLFLAVDPDNTERIDKMLVDRIRDRIDNIVCVERGWQNLPAVIFGRANAAEQAVTHLIKLGHRRIGFVGSLDSRIDGYRRSLHAYHIAYDEQLVAAGVTWNSPQDGHRQARELLSLAAPPTALFACSDEVAIGAIGGLSECGLSVPHDMAIASVDDIPIAAFVSPRLTTVHVPKAEMGAYAVRMLNERTERADTPAVTAVLPTELIVRESCGALARSAAGHEAHLSHTAT